MSMAFVVRNATVVVVYLTVPVVGPKTRLIWGWWHPRRLPVYWYP